MSRVLRIGGLGVVVVVVAVWTAIDWQGDRTYIRSYDHVLGTSLDLKVRAASDAAADRAAGAVLAEIDREASILSGYDPSSEFSRWMASRNVAVPVSPELFDVLRRFDVWRERTGGALDAAAETVSRVWKASAAAGRLPADRDISGAVARVKQPHWHLDAEHRTATHLSDAPLVLNTFTKSYIVDRAAAAGLAAPGVSGIVVNLGGDLVARGAVTEAVGVSDPQAASDNADPLATLLVTDRAVATSGGYRRGFEIGGTHYSHIVDPRTGRPTGHVLSATVVARDAADAGALATAFCVLTPDESEQLSRVVPGAEFLLVLADGRRIESANWRRLTQRPVPSVASQTVATLHAAEQDTWNPNFELTVALTIAPQSFRAQRPYLAVWVENKDHYPVRTLAVWYRASHPRWLPDLRAWFRGDRLRAQAEGTDLIGSVSSATRGPGAYTLTWNGKDNAGHVVKAGTYTVLIEVAREHGTYQIMRQQMDFSGVASKVELTGNVEVSAASLDYHRVVVK